MIGLDDELQNCELPSFLVIIVGQECSNYRSTHQDAFFCDLVCCQVFANVWSNYKL